MRSWLVAIASLLSMLAASPAAAHAAQAADPAIWEGEQATGPILHRASNVTLPAELEGFSRSQVRAVSNEDVAAS